MGMGAAQADCAVIIVNWKSADYLAGCLESLRQQQRTRLRVIVVDNDSGPCERQTLAQLPIDRLIENDCNVGFAAAVNQAFRECSEEYVFILNPDTRVVGSAVEDLIEFLKSNPEASAVAPGLFSEDGLRRRSVLPLPSPFGLWFRLLPPVRLLSNLSWRISANRVRRVEGVWGAAILLRSGVFRQIGGFDERFFLYVEDSDLFRRMKQAKLHTFYKPTAKVIHFGGVSQARSEIDRNEMNWNNLVQYFRKHHSALDIQINLRMLRALMAVENCFRPGHWSPTVLATLKAALAEGRRQAASTTPVDPLR